MDVSELWTTWLAERCPEAQQKLFEHYWPLSCSFARKIADNWPGDLIDDALGYAAVGLSEALLKYDPDKGASFATYASIRVPGAVTNGLRKLCDVRDIQTLQFADIPLVTQPDTFGELCEEVEAILSETDYLIFKLRYVYKLKVEDAKHFVEGHNYRDMIIRLRYIRETIQNHIRFGHLREGDSYAGTQSRSQRV